MQRERLGASTRRARQDDDHERDDFDPVTVRIGPDAGQRTAFDLAGDPEAQRRARAWMLFPGKLTLDDVGLDTMTPAQAIAYADLVSRPMRIDRAADASAAYREEHGALALGFAQLDPGRGASLPAALAAALGRELGIDATAVRIHTDDAAARMATRLGARAFTIGDDVYFARGGYDPSSDAGVRLIAHEVAHVAQQRRATAMPGGAPGATISRPDDAHEHDAEAFATRFARAWTDRSDPATLVDRVRRDGQRAELPFADELGRHFGRDFGDVELYGGDIARIACDAMEAAAFAIQNVVVIADPSPTRELMLHELTHVMQSVGRAPARFAPGSLAVGARDSAAEHEAHAAPGAGHAHVAAPAGTIHRADKAAAKPADTSTVDDRLQAFLQRSDFKLEIVENIKKRPFGYKEAEGTYFPIYRTSSPRPFKFEDYKAFLKTSKFKNADFTDDLAASYRERREALRLARIEDTGTRRYVFLGGIQDYHESVTDLRVPERKKETDQFPAYLDYVDKLRDKGRLKEKDFKREPAKKEDASTYRDRMRTAIATDYSKVKGNAWHTFHVEVVEDPEIFGTPHQRIQGDIFAELVELTASVKGGGSVTAVEPMFHPVVKKKLEERHGDGYIVIKKGDLAKKAIIAECKAVSRPPGAQEKAQIKAYRVSTDPEETDIKGHFSTPQSLAGKDNVKEIKFTHVVFIFSIPPDSAANKKLLRAWETAIREEFKGDLNRYSIEPDVRDDEDKVEYKVRFNPELAFISSDLKTTRHVFSAPKEPHPGITIRSVHIQSDKPGSPHVTGGLLDFDLDMAGAIGTKGIERKIHRAKDGDVGTADNGFPNLQTGLDRFLGKVSASANLTTEGVSATIKIPGGNAQIAGFSLEETSFTATLGRGDALDLAGRVKLRHKSGKIHGEVGIRWAGEWIIDGLLDVDPGLVDGLKKLQLGILYQGGHLTLSAPRAEYEKTIGNVVLGGEIRGLTYDVKDGTVGGLARIDADLGMLGKASGEAEMRKNHLDRLELTYDTPVLKYPAKGKKPVIEGQIGGKVIYDHGRFHGQIDGQATIVLPGLEKVAANGLGLAVQARINAGGTYGGSIMLTEELTFGKYLRITELSAEIDGKGDVSSKFALELHNIDGLRPTRAACEIKDGEFHLVEAQTGIEFGKPGVSRAWGTLDLAYRNKAVVIDGNVTAKIRDGLEAVGKVHYSSETDEIDIEVSTAKPIQLLSGGDSKTFWTFDRQTELVSFYHIVGVYLNTKFELKFKYDYDVHVTPTIKLQHLNLTTWDFGEASASLAFGGHITAELIGIPYLGLGLYLLDPSILRGDGGLLMELSAKATLDLNTTLSLGYKPDGGFSGDAMLDLALKFGINAAIKPHAEFHVLGDLYEPEWTGGALANFPILPEREIFRYGLDLNKSLKPATEQPKLPDAAQPQASPPRGKELKQTTSGSKYAGADTRAVSGDKPRGTDDPNGLAMGSLTDQLEQLPGYSTFKWVFDKAVLAYKGGKMVYEGGKWVVGKAADAAEAVWDAGGDAIDAVGDFFSGGTPITEMLKDPKIRKQLGFDD